MNIHNTDQPLFSSDEIRSLTNLPPSEESQATLSSSFPFHHPSSDNLKPESVTNNNISTSFPLNAQGMVDENMLNMFMMSAVDPHLISGFMKAEGMSPSSDISSSSSCPTSPLGAIPDRQFVVQDGPICEVNIVAPEAQQPIFKTPASKQSTNIITNANCDGAISTTTTSMPPPSPSMMMMCSSPSPSPSLVHNMSTQKLRKKNTSSSTNNKRKLETEPLSPLTADGLLSNGFESCAQLSPDEERSLKRQRRLVKNREAAQQFRQRQKNYIADLENRVEELSAMNSEYASKIDILISENKIIREQLSRLHDFVSQAMPGRQVPFPLMYVPPSSLLSVPSSIINKDIISSEPTPSSSSSSSSSPSSSNHLLPHHHTISGAFSPMLNMANPMAMHHQAHPHHQVNMLNAHHHPPLSMDTSSSSSSSCLPVDYHGFAYSFYPHHYTGMTMPVSAPHFTMMNSMCSPLTTNNMVDNIMAPPPPPAACEQTAN